MKKGLYLFAFLTILFADTAHAQDVKFKKKFISSRNTRVSLGVGLEGAFSGKKGNSIMSWNVGTTRAKYDYLDKTGDTTQSFDYLYGAAGLMIDVYSPNSILGLCFGANYSFYGFRVFDKSKTRFDRFDISSVEIPVYLKLRFGPKESTHHFWWQLGASYSMPLIAKRYYSGTGVTESNRQMAQGNFAVGTMIGFEQFISYGKNSSAYGAEKSDKDNMRMILFLRINYKLQSILNKNYSKFNEFSSAIGSHTNIDYRDLTLSLGVMYFFRLGKKKSE